MALKIGNNAVANAFVGSSQVRRAYKGGTLVYQGWGPSSEREFMQLTSPGGPSELLKCYGKTIAWAQLVKNGDFSDGTTNWQGNNGTISAAGGILTWTATNTLTYANLRQASTGFLNGHKYFVSFIIKGAQANKLDFALGNAAGGGVSGSFDYGTDWTTIHAIISPLTATDFSLYIRPNAMAVSGAVAYFKGPIVIIDLTLLYGAGHEPASVAAFLADYPEYNPTYDPDSLQSNKTAELWAERIPVINVWDEEWQSGNIDSTTGENTANLTTIRATNYTPVLPNTQYYIEADNYAGNVRMRFYDANKAYIGYAGQVISSGIFTTPNDCYYMRIVLYSTTTYGNDICINVSDPAINGHYYSHWRDPLALNLSTLTSGGVAVFPDGMRGVGSIRDEAEGSTGVVRLGKRAYQTGDESDTSVLTDGTNTIYPLATPLTYTLDTPLPTDLTCEQGDILQRVSDNNCPFVGEMRFGL